MPKRVALIGNQASSMLNFRRALIIELVRRGHHVFAFAPDFDGSTRTAIEELGAQPIDHRLARTGVNPFKDLMGVIHLADQLRSLRPDVALGYTVKPVTYGTFAAALAGVPSRYALIEGLGHVFMEAPTLPRRVMRRGVAELYRWALKLTKKTFFLNPDDQREFTALGLVGGDVGRTIGGIGVDLKTWSAAPPWLEPIRFLFVGRLLREKGLGEFIAAARLIKERQPLVEFIVLGDIDSNPSSFTREQVLDWVNEGLIDWPGHVPVAPWIERSSVFVLPSYREGVPRSTQEAMAMGRAVISTDVAGCRETVAEGHNGFLVPARDGAALAAAMQRFIDSPSLIDSMGRASRSMAEQRFDQACATSRLVAELDL